MLHISEVVKLKHNIRTELTRMLVSGEFAENPRDILNKIVREDTPRYRCCMYKERAVLEERLKTMMCQSTDLDLEEAAKRAFRGEVAEDHVVKVLPIACDQCPIDKFIVTNACRNCLAHSCMNNCPRNAIMIVQNHAYIDKSKCVECGLCKRSCQYSAIIEVNRPCESACALGAIKAGSDRKATIDYDKCVQCGSCKVACPFGAIEETTCLAQLITQLKSGGKVNVMLAPSYTGQFGVKIRPGQLVSGLKKMGFGEVYEAAYGADIVSVAEGDEYVANVPDKYSFMTTSCCPAFVSMIEKYMPEIRDNVSSSVSPMIAMAMYMKAQDSTAKVAFIGPCSAKKGEAKKYPDIVDYVLTFDELNAMFEGYGIVLENEAETDFAAVSSKLGSGFAAAGGVAKAVTQYLAASHPQHKGNLEVCSADGLANCRNVLKQIETGKLKANFIEGMACTGGCIGGPGAIADARVTSKLIERQSATRQYVSAADMNEVKQEVRKNSRLHTHHA